MVNISPNYRFSNGRVIFLCCFFIYSIIFAELSGFSENEVLAFEKNEFSSDILNKEISEKIAYFVNNGYPFVKISPKINEINDSIFVELVVKKGNLAENVNTKFIINGKLKEYLVNNPIKKNLEKNFSYYNYNNLLRAQEILKSKQYIESIVFYSPEIRDSITEIPVEIVPFNSMLFDGGVGLATFPKTRITGNANLSIINVLGFGEMLDFSFTGEELFYQINGELEIPYIFKTPFGLLLSASTEISDTLYGTISISAGMSYFNELWSAKFYAEYSEISVLDTTTKYSGIKITLENNKKKFAMSKRDMEYQISAKSGIVYDKNDWFHKGEILAKSAFHIPFKRFAVLTKPNFGAIAFESPNTLHQTQLFRLGGANSVRGYQESSFSALAFGGIFNEFRYYISNFSAVYVFGDYAAMINDNYSIKNTEQMFGYGLGISLPVRKLTLSLEWARHVNDFSNLGRLHFRISNY